jgi:hypothetical protein
MPRREHQIYAILTSIIAAVLVACEIVVPAATLVARGGVWAIAGLCTAMAIGHTLILLQGPRS